MKVIALVSEPKNAFGELLKHYRNKKQLTLRQLEEKVPFSFSHLSRMESGERNPPEREGVIQIAKALDADVDEMLLAAGYSPESATFRKPSLGILNEFGEAEYPPTEWEREMMATADRLGISFDIFTRPGFWAKPPAERRRLFKDIEDVIDEVRELMGGEENA